MYGSPARVWSVEGQAPPDAQQAAAAKVRTAAMELKSIEKSYATGAAGPVRALNRVSLHIRDGELFTLLGPSGCGKTTLLRVIGGFEPVSRGQVLLFGNDLGYLPPHCRPINTVFQHYALFPHLTVEENVAFGPEMLGWSRRKIRESVRHVLSLVQMEPFAGRRPGELSGGQQQRIALARALASRPRVLLLDEPLSALDLKLRQSMRLELKDLQARTGITFIFVTHDQEEALIMSDRLAVMRAGEIQQVGTPEEIYEGPVNRFVAEFIGDTNIIPASVEALDGSLARCSFPGGRLTVANAGGKSPGDRVTLVVRPEKLRISASRDPDDCEVFEGRALDRVYLGTDTRLRILVGNAITLVARQQNSGFGRNLAARNARVWIRPAPGSVRMLGD